jgi:hypothetical protein
MEADVQSPGDELPLAQLVPRATRAHADHAAEAERIAVVDEDEVEVEEPIDFTHCPGCESPVIRL